MEQLFEKYTNVQLFAIKYRKYELFEDKFLPYEDFKNKMQIFGYVSHKFKNQSKDNQIIDIYLFKHDSNYISSTIYFKKLLDKYNGPTNIIMITKEELNVYRKKTIKQYNNINLKNYLHKHFIIEINKGPLCSKHTVLTTDESRRVCYDLMCHAHKLPAIFQSDPQCIWAGGEVNDIIKIESNSEICGKTIRYRIVTPSSGKVLQSSLGVIKKEDVTKVDIVEEPAEEIDYVEDYADGAEDIGDE